MIRLATTDNLRLYLVYSRFQGRVKVESHISPSRIMSYSTYSTYSTLNREYKVQEPAPESLTASGPPAGECGLKVESVEYVESAHSITRLTRDSTSTLLTKVESRRTYTVGTVGIVPLPT